MLYIMLGYAGSEQREKKDMYARDCWRLRLLPNPGLPGARNLAASTAAPAICANGATAATALHAGKQQIAGTKRPSGQRDRSKSPVGGGHSGAANNAPASGMWRTAKRQRSGALAMQQPCQQQQQASVRGDRQQRMEQIDATAAEVQLQPQQPLQQLSSEQQQPIQQLPHPQSPARQFSSMDAHAAAAAAALWAARQGQFVAGNERSCPGSPNYSGPLEVR